MGPETGFSFRVVQPAPPLGVKSVPLDFEIQCGLEISKSSLARGFSKIITSLGFQNHLSNARGIFGLYWFASLRRNFQLSRKLFSAHPQMAEQIRLGLQGYARVPRRTRVMGILNVTPDSFSDGGKAFDPFKALDQALQMQAEGADLIDIGGESTRPGARGVSAEEEIKRVIPVLPLLSKKIKIPLSIDTTKAEVARRAVGQGVSLVNDISALQGDPRMAETLKRLGVPVVLMHMKGRPRTMQRAPRYGEVITEIMTFFRFRVRFALEKGIPLKNLILDPGFGFGKTPWHNIELTRRLWEFKILGLPLMFAPSRKATLGVLTGGLPPDERLESTAAAVTAGILAGADFVRVHDVQSMVRVVKIADAIRNDRGLTRP